MSIADFFRDQRFGDLKWYNILGIVLFVFAIALLANITLERFTPLILALIAYASFRILHETLKSSKQNSEKVENLIGMLMRNQNLLNQININTHLSEPAKNIIFKDNITMEIKEAVIAKLHQKDFDSTDELIKAVSKFEGYSKLAKQLETMVEDYKNAPEEERIEQSIDHINKLCQECHWAQAFASIKNLIDKYPQSEKVRQTAKGILDKKNKKKAELLEAWDNAVKEGQTDHSLEILRELDMYLTPAEGLALQESAGSVFRNKLHSLGVEFSVAVTQKDWQKALVIGQDIVKGFPNSRMAHEIRSKMDVLNQRAKNKK